MLSNLLKITKKIWKVAGLVIPLVLILTAPNVVMAEMEIIAGIALFPEGPVYHNGNVYYVEYSGDKLTKWDGKKKITIHEKKGCGHNGLVLTPEGEFIIVCFNSNEVIRTTMDGKELEVITKDDKGQPFDNPNDAIVDSNGGIYLTTSGPWTAYPEKIGGGVYYRAPGSKKFREVADDIHFANGLVLSNDGKTLYVGEMVGNRVLKFKVEKDGSLSDRSLFVRLNDLVPDPPDASIWIGPDGMKVDSKGNLYVAQYLGGRVIVISPDRKLVRTLEVPGLGSTNLCFGKTEMYLYITAAIDMSGPTWVGKVWKVKNE
jgi:sugar lactone lactonase YvrE